MGAVHGHRRRNCVALGAPSTANAQGTSEPTSEERVAAPAASDREPSRKLRKRGRGAVAKRRSYERRRQHGGAPCPPRLRAAASSAVPHGRPLWRGLVRTCLDQGGNVDRQAVKSTANNSFPPTAQTITTITISPEVAAAATGEHSPTSILGYNFPPRQRTDRSACGGKGTIANAQSELKRHSDHNPQQDHRNDAAGTTNVFVERSPPPTFPATVSPNGWGGVGAGEGSASVDPRRPLIMWIGGYTYGGFEWGSRSFGLNGATVGGGLGRHSIAPGWTLKRNTATTQFEGQIGRGRALRRPPRQAAATTFSNNTSFTATIGVGPRPACAPPRHTHYSTVRAAVGALRLAARPRRSRHRLERSSICGVSYGPVSIRRRRRPRA